MDDTFQINRVISRLFQAIGAYPVAFLGLALAIAGVPHAVLGVIQFTELGTLSDNPFEVLGPGLPAFFGAWLLVGAITNALLGAIVIRATVTHLSRRKVDWSACVTMALRLLIPLVVIGILTSIGVTIGYLLLIVPGVILTLAWSVTIPAYVQEKIGILDCFKRSHDLTDGYKGSIFLLYLAFGIAGAILSTISEAAGNAALNSSPYVGAALGGVFQGISAMLWATLSAAIYVELRTVKEGTEVDTLAAIFT